VVAHPPPGPYARATSPPSQPGPYNSGSAPARPQGPYGAPPQGAHNPPPSSQPPHAVGPPPPPGAAGRLPGTSNTVPSRMIQKVPPAPKYRKFDLCSVMSSLLKFKHPAAGDRSHIPESVKPAYNVILDQLSHMRQTTPVRVPSHHRYSLSNGFSATTETFSRRFGTPYQPSFRRTQLRDAF
jgi:protein transport protein SEC31